MMQAHVDTNPMTGITKVWIYSLTGPYGSEQFSYLVNEGAGQWSTVEQPANQEPPEPTLELSRFAAEALASALATMGRPEEATQRHLTDAIKVRDRLLTMLEKT